MDHLLADRGRFLEELEREWQELDPDPFPGEPLLEPVHPARPVFRVNLRPARRMGIDPAELGTALAHQPLRGGTWDELQELWTGTVRLAREGHLPFAPEELRAQGWELRRTRRPPRHSPRYRALNLPAYRLIHDLGQTSFRCALAGTGEPGGVTKARGSRDPRRPPGNPCTPPGSSCGQSRTRPAGGDGASG